MTAWPSVLYAVNEQIAKSCSGPLATEKSKRQGAKNAKAAKVFRGFRHWWCVLSMQPVFLGELGVLGALAFRLRLAAALQ